MKNRESHHGHPLRLQSGFSIVELLIAVTLGLLIVAAVGSLFVSSSQSYKTQGAVSQVQEEGRFANLLIMPIVRQAGYLANPITQTNPASVFSASRNKLAVFGFSQANASTAIGSRYRGLSASSVVAGDVIAIAFEGKNPTTPADVPLKTCLGRDVDASQVAVNVFFISSDNGVNSLSCYDNISAITDNTSAATASTNVQPLVAGVTDMQILYGIDTDNDSDANRYVTAAAVTDWTAVASVKIVFTVDSVDATEKTRTSAADVTGTGRIRHRFDTTVEIRNRLRS